MSEAGEAKGRRLVASMRRSHPEAADDRGPHLRTAVIARFTEPAA